MREGLSRPDLVIGSVLGVAVLIMTLAAARLVSPAFFVYGDDFDIWFQSDLPRVFANMTDPDSNNLRATVHPLFSPIALALVGLTRLLTRLPDVPAVRLVVAGTGAAWITGLFLVLRLSGFRRLDALLFGGLAAASAAFIFWSTVPETYVFGAMSTLPALFIVLLARSGPLSSWWLVGASALSLSITVTNWMAGVAAAFICQPWKRALRISAGAFLAVLVLSKLQELVLSNVGAMLNWIYEVRYVLPNQGAGLWRVALSFLFHTLVMPTVQIGSQGARPGFNLLTQMAAPGSATWFGTLGVALWAVLLGIGLVSLLALRAHGRLRLMLGLMLVGQLTLHAVYGEETFLYSMHWLGPLVLTAALGCLTPARPLVLGLAAGVLVCAGVNNLLQLREAASSLVRHGTPRQVVRHEVQSRLRDPWPRGEGHVVLGFPGSPAEAKAYHEPAGSFSPSVGSFGVALWVVDAEGRVRLTSDSVATTGVSQRFVWPEGSTIPGIESATASYKARWAAVRPGQWSLDVEPTLSGDERLLVVLRSVGPAGGPIRELTWSEGVLTVNGTWTVQVDPPPRSVHLGPEGARGPLVDGTAAPLWRGDHGWGLARIELRGGHHGRLVLTDRSRPGDAGSSHAAFHTGLSVSVPDERFVASIEAQIAHLLMGVVRAQTRPGDPYHFPTPWLRDGTYVVAALARAGHLDQARSLAQGLAERDFFGGLGSEADAPGLALWALGEVAERVRDPAYDRWLWPHVRRKADLIETMLSSSTPVRQAPADPTVPEFAGHPYVALVAMPARDGLIVGRIGTEFPVLYVNAVSYRGLLSAAALASRIGQPESAERWRTRAARQGEAWRALFARMAAESAWQTRSGELTRALRAAIDGHGYGRDWRGRINDLREGVKRSLREPIELENQRTYSVVRWPAGLATNEIGPLRAALDRAWRGSRDSHGGFLRRPARPALEIAQAHQWLALGDPDRAWATMRWFLDHQVSPGLYSWWDGVGEENTFHRWERIRGWVNPPHITPHYRAAGEMLMLQLDMLAYADPADDGAAVIIGAGIPPEWSRQPMTVQGLSVPQGRLDWRWDGGREMRVKLTGARRAVRLGPPFPADATLLVEYHETPR